ncbi:formin-binding protein 1-like isoform X1 [Diaphorina citri]|uniref:Formin-binding protein 1-like isoform X1 n=1 Tax=Diaphorina citri TaxID=121845 RepID=A0A1S3DBI6_DIACI|nr:formin-binding protein 1-like isoform X1 [Diaphorina citri]
MMSWGTELWDQYDNLSLHTQKGIDFLEKYGHFIRDRCAIEMEYAGKLRRLVKNYQPKKEEEDYQYSTCKAFKCVLDEVTDLAGQHEVIAENLQVFIIKEVTIFVKDFKEERKKHLQDGARMMNLLENQVIALERARKNYDKAYRESDKALEHYKRADADLELSRAEVEKQRINMAIKSQHCEDTKTEYANQLQRANEMQRQHYTQAMPEVFAQLQELDEKRVRNIRNFMVHSANIEKKVFPIINQCLDGIIKAADQINEKEDSALVIERYKSGFTPPGDIPFEDLSRGGESTPIAPAFPHLMGMRPEAATVRGTMSAGRLKRRVGLLGLFSSNKEIFKTLLQYHNNVGGFGSNGKDDFSNLPPSQRKKKLQQRIEEIQHSIQQESAAREGLIKMKGVYEDNPNLGDPHMIEGQLSETDSRLEKLRGELQKYQTYMEESEANSPAGMRKNSGGGGNNNVNSTSGSSGGVNGVQTQQQRVNVNGGSNNNRDERANSAGEEEESLSRSASDSSVHNNNHSKLNSSSTQLPNISLYQREEPDIGTSHTSLPESDPPEYFDLPPLGTAKALYPFEATSEGSIPMYDGEELYIIELDQGDGWTRVRRQTDSEEGFVPTSYIQTIALDNV